MDYFKSVLESVLDSKVKRDILRALSVASLAVVVWRIWRRRQNRQVRSRWEKHYDFIIGERVFATRKLLNVY